MKRRMNPFAPIAAIVAITAVVTAAAGWVNNVFWTFHQTELPSLALGVLGALVAPIGVLHGVYLWF